MNFQRNKKQNKLRRISQELEEELPQLEDYNPEVGADLRWSIIYLLRALKGI